MNFYDENKTIIDMKTIINRLIDEHQANDDKEFQWMYKKCSNEKLKLILLKMTVLMLHVLENISQNNSINCKTISENISVLKGTVSKIVNKLVNYKLITYSYLPNNKKEKLYTATELGRELASLHEQMHKEYQKKLMCYLASFSEEDFQTAYKLINAYLNFDINKDEPN